MTAMARRGGTRFALALIGAAGLALRMFHLSVASLWNDELFTGFYPRLGVVFMWTGGFSEETTPPTYYTILAGWTHFLGTSAATLRLPSVIFSTLAIPLVYRLGMEFGKRGGGLIAAMIFAFAPMEIYFAQEARAYALMLLPVGLAMLGAMWFLRGPATSPGAIYYVIGIVLAVYVHNISILVAAAAAIVVAMDVLTDQRHPRAERWRLLARWLAANAVATVLCVPELLAILSEVRSDQLYWMSPMTLWDVRYALSTFVAGPAVVPLVLASCMAIALLAAILAALARTRIDRHALSVLIAIPTLYFALILATALRQPVLVPRLLCWMWLPLAVLLALCMQGRGFVHLLLRGVAVVVLIIGLGFQLTQNATAKEPWGVFLARVAPLVARADLVVTGPWTQPMALVDAGIDMAKVRYWTENFPPTIESTAIHDLLGVRDISRDDLVAAVLSGRRVLLIQRSVEYRYRVLLHGLPEPSETTGQQCWSDPYCLGALYWGGTP
jgi:hypothetical protein